MSRTIDERIVQMTFNNQEFEDRAKTTLSTLLKLKTATDQFATGDWLGGMARGLANSGLSSISVTTSKISESFNLLEEVAVGALRRIGEMAVQTGTQLLNSLTVKPFKESWAKYDEIIASEQSIMSAVEGKFDAEGIAYDMEAVVKRVDRLKWYADETSYSITQMTNAVGQFTSSGQDLDKSVTAVIGIANACADAGVSTQKAESAFIGFSRAIGAGTLTLGVWNHQLRTSGITNSERFKKTLIETAAAMGTLKEQADGTFKNLKGETVNTANFTEHLNDGIITAEVMVKALEKYADTTEMVREIQFKDVTAIRDLYKTAGKEMSEDMAKWVDSVEKDGTTASDVIENLTKAYEELGLEVPQSLKALRRAQEAISFKQAIDATAEAITSQFSNIYHTMVGNYEEAKELWTKVANDLNEWFVGPMYDLVDTFSIVRNLWDELGEGVPTQMMALWNDFADVINSIRETFDWIYENIFHIPDMEDAAKGIFDFIEKIRKSLQDFNEAWNDPSSISFAQTLKDTLTGLAGIIKKLLDVGKEFVNSFIKPLAERIKPIFEDLMGIISDFWFILDNTNFDGLSTLEKILRSLLDILDPIISVIEALVKWIKELTGSLAQAAADGENINVFSGLLKSLGDIFEKVGKAIKNSTNIFKTLFDALSGVFDKLKGIVTNFLQSNGTNVAKLAEGGILAYIVAGLTVVVRKLKKLDLAKVLEGISNFFNKDDGSKGFLDTIQETFETLTNSLKTFTESIKIKLLDTISNSLIKLAGALLIISLIDSDKIASSLTSIAVVLTEMVVALAALNKINPGASIMNSARAFSKISTGLIMLAVALKIVSSIQPEAMKTALVGLGVALLGVMIFIAAINKMTKYMRDVKLATLGAVFKQIGFGLIEIATALKIMSGIPMQQMMTALVGLGGSLLAMMGFMVITTRLIKDNTGAKLIAMGKALTNMSVGLIAMSLALKILASIDDKDMGKALISLAGALLALGVFMAAMSNGVGGGSFVAISAGMLILSTSLVVLAGALALFGSMNLSTLGKGFLALGGALLSVVAYGALFGSMAPLLLLGATALAALGAASILAAKGLVEFMGAYALIQALGGNIGEALIDVFEQAVTGLILVIPMFIAGVIDAIIQTADKIVDLAIKLIDVLIKAVTECFPKIVTLGIDILYAILKGIRDSIKEFVVVALEIISELINGLGEGLPVLLDAMFGFIIDVINGLAEMIRNNAGEFGSAIGNLASALITGFIDGLASGILSFGAGLLEGGKGIWDHIIGFFSGTEAQEGNIKAGSDTIDGVKAGIEEKKPELDEVVREVGDDIVEELDREDDAMDSAESTANGFILKINELLPMFTEAGTAAGSAFMSGFNSAKALDINSPSRAAAQSAKYVVEGFINGIEKGVKDILNSGTDFGNSFVDALSQSIKAAETLLNDDLNPTITPVLDLSNVRNGAGAIAGLLNSNASLNTALAASPLSFNGNIQNGASSNSGTKEITMYNTFEINGVKDMDAIQVKNMASMLYNELNELLGNEI